MGGGGSSGENDLTNSANGGIMNTESDTVTAEKEQEYGVPYGADAVNADMEYINSDNFARKFDNITENKAVNRALLECSRQAITHRNGTLYKDMYFINGNTGEIMASQLNTPAEQSINHNEGMRKAICDAKMRNIPVIALHTHPEGYPPSVDDFNSAFEHNYSLCVVVGHNGQVYSYKTPTVIVDNIDIIQLNINFAYKAGADIDRVYQEILLIMDWSILL